MEPVSAPIGSVVAGSARPPSTVGGLRQTRPGSVSPSSAASPVSTADVASIRRAAQEFEAIVLGQMLKTMRQAGSQGPMALTGTSQKLYRDLMDDELAKTIARKGGVGLADVLVRDLLRLGYGPKKPLKSQEPAADGRPVGSETSEGVAR